MIIDFHKNFKKNYKLRITRENLKKRVAEKIEKFRQNPNDPLLHNHPLKGAKKGLRAFSISGDIRIVYYVENDACIFLDIGTHNQVY